MEEQEFGWSTNWVFALFLALFGRLGKVSAKDVTVLVAGEDKDASTHTYLVSVLQCGIMVVDIQ